MKSATLTSPRSAAAHQTLAKGVHLASLTADREPLVQYRATLHPGQPAASLRPVCALSRFRRCSAECRLVRRRRL